MLVLVYRKCSTCQKALKWLEEHKIFFEERAIVDENPTYEELKEWYVLQHQRHALQADEPQGQASRDGRRRTAQTPRHRRHAGQTPTRNWRRLRPDRIPREGVGGKIGVMSEIMTEKNTGWQRC